MCRSCGDVPGNEYETQPQPSEKRAFEQGVLRLPRGGIVVTTAKGISIQFGIPPETIKDCFRQNVPVPQIFCLPKELFDRVHGVNVAEAEFPAYFNFFVLQKRVTFLGTPEQEARLRTVFQETLLGPRAEDICVDRGEFDESVPLDVRPDLVAECAALRTFHSIDELFNFFHFNEQPAWLADPERQAAGQAAQGFRDAHPSPQGVNTTATKAGVLSTWALAKVAPRTVADFAALDMRSTEVAPGVIIVDCGDAFVVLEDGEVQGVAPSCVRLMDHPYQKNVLHSSPSRPPFKPPRFGVTILGSGHGFDPSHRTSGFVLWINRRGVVIDPPLNSREVLHAHGVPSRLVDTVIVTHCHADHDQGTFQKLLEENQLTLITTATIVGSFVRKYGALTGLSEASLRRLFVFRPVVFGQDMRVGGAEFRFFYSIHTIPCIGFEVYFGGKSLYFSGDTCYDLKLISKFEQDGNMRPGRARFWREFNYHHNVVLHEAGVPPIHTPVDILRTFPDEVKKRMYLIHTSTSAIPEDSGLRIAPEGVEQTIVVSNERQHNGDGIELLKLLDTVDLFRQEPRFTLSQASDLLADAMIRKYTAGEVIFDRGAAALEFFVVASGVVNIVSEPPVRERVSSSPKTRSLNDSGETTGQIFSKFLVSGDYFGEMALVTGGGRTAYAVAKTTVTCVVFAKDDFLAVLRGSSQRLEFVQTLAARRSEPSWDVIRANSVFARMTNAQRTKLQSIMERVSWQADDLMWRPNDPADFGLLVADGSVRYDSRPDLLPFGRGAYIGDSKALRDGLPHTEQLSCVTKGWGYRMPRNGYLDLIHDYPGVALCLHDTLFLEGLIVEDDDAQLSEPDSPGSSGEIPAIRTSDGADWDF